MNADWGFNGTGEFEWFEVAVTSAFSRDGKQSDNDPIIGKRILSNLIRPYAKLTDLDTDCQKRSTIYGMKFGLCTADSNSVHPQMAFIGDWTPSIIAQNMWPRITCYSQDNTGGELYQDSFCLGASSTTIIKDIKWADVLESTVLQQLKELSGEKLSVRVTLSYYTRNLPSLVAYKATLGHVTGTIGIYNPEIDTLNVPGQRILQPTSNVPLGMTFGKDDLCRTEKYRKNAIWLYAAPFEIDQANGLHIDFSNSFPVHLNNKVRNIGTLKLGYLDEEQGCVILLKDEDGIQYLKNTLLKKYGGIHTYTMKESEATPLSDYKLVVVQMVNGSDDPSTTHHTCGTTLLQIPVQVLLEEAPFYIRPVGYYVNRLSAGSKPVSDPIEFYVAHYGKPVQSPYQIRVRNYFDSQQCPDTCSASCKKGKGRVIPVDGVIPENEMKPIENGRASFRFTISTKIPPEREYFCPPCDEDGNKMIPIDGNVYYFEYALCKQDADCYKYEQEYAPVFLAFSSPTDSIQDSEIDWVHDIGPVLSQYAQTAPTMKTRSAIIGITR